MEDPADQTGALERSLEQLRASDGKAFNEAREAIIRQSGDRLEQLVRRMLKNYPRLRRWEQTGDVLQNALLRLHRSLAEVRPGTARQFYGLAATQIRRELIDLTRHHFGPRGKAARHHTDGAQPAGGGLVENQADPGAEPASLEEWTEFHEAVQRLPDEQRDVVELHWYQGLNQKIVAALLGVTDRTVKMRWRDAKLRLRRMLADD